MRLSKLDRYETALMEIAYRGGANKCAKFTGDQVCRTLNSGLMRNAQYGADQWCEHCVAADALEL